MHCPAGSKTRITDTRKTTPGLRALERYAVRCGGGHNHREDLGRAVLIKDNHVAACGRRAGVPSSAPSAYAPHTSRIAVRGRQPRSAAEALAAGADAIMLDNFDDTDVARAVAHRAGPRDHRGLGRRRPSQRIPRARRARRRRDQHRRAHALRAARSTSGSTGDERRSIPSGIATRAADRALRPLAARAGARPAPPTTTRAATAAAGAVDGHVVVADKQVSRARRARPRPGSLAGRQRPVRLDHRAAARAARGAAARSRSRSGLGVADAVRRAPARLAARSRVKWPNDVGGRRKKSCGILVEAGATGGETSAIVIGIGFNVNRMQFDGELAANATSLRLASGTELDRARACWALLLGAVERGVDASSPEGQRLDRRPRSMPRLALRGEPRHAATTPARGRAAGLAR